MSSILTITVSTHLSTCFSHQPNLLSHFLRVILWLWILIFSLLQPSYFGQHLYCRKDSEIKNWDRFLILKQYHKKTHYTYKFANFPSKFSLSCRTRLPKTLRMWSKVRNDSRREKFSKNDTSSYTRKKQRTKSHKYRSKVYFFQTESCIARSMLTSKAWCIQLNSKSIRGEPCI